MARAPKPYTITVRLTEEQRERLETAAQMGMGPYPIKLTDIIARGIELAAQEIERMEGRL